MWVLDSALSQAPANAANEVVRVIQGLRTIKLPLPSRSDLAPLLQGKGFSQALAQWMTTNLRRADDGYRWTFDLAAVEDMMADYFVQDLWPVLEDPPCTVHLLRAERSDRLDPTDEARIATLPRVQLHTLPDAGHWVHADNPDGLLAILAPAFAIPD